MNDSAKELFILHAITLHSFCSDQSILQLIRLFNITQHNVILKSMYLLCFPFTIITRVIFIFLFIAT